MTTEPWTDWAGREIRALRKEVEALKHDLKRCMDRESALVNAQVDRSPEGQDPLEGLDRNDESPVAEGHAPKPSELQ